MQLLLAETFYGGSAAPKAVHEVCFKVPVRVVAVRIVGQGEAPHPELSFQGQTPDAPFVLELFGAMRGKGALCAALLSEPYQHEAISGALVQLAPTEELLDYVVIRCGHAHAHAHAEQVHANRAVQSSPTVALRRVDTTSPVSICFYGTSADHSAQSVPAWQSLPGFWCAWCVRCRDRGAPVPAVCGRAQMGGLFGATAQGAGGEGLPRLRLQRRMMHETLAESANLLVFPETTEVGSSQERPSSPPGLGRGGGAATRPVALTPASPSHLPARCSSRRCSRTLARQRCSSNSRPRRPSARARPGHRLRPSWRSAATAAAHHRVRPRVPRRRSSRL